MSIKSNQKGVDHSPHRPGDDVRGSDSGLLVTTGHLRSRLDDVFGSDVTTYTATLHRLALNEVGMPLWKFDSHSQLLRGLKAALDVHAALYKKGILHRDVSACNILLSGQSQGYGFLTDLDIAYVSEDHGEVRDANVHASYPTSLSEFVAQHRAYTGRLPAAAATPRSFAKPQRLVFGDLQHRAEMTGTLQFMAVEILKAIYMDFTLRHSVDHDVESFTYVLGYAVLRHYYEAVHSTVHLEVRKVLQSVYQESFNQVTIGEIVNNRTNIFAREHPVAWLPNAFEATVGKNVKQPNAPPNRLVQFQDWCHTTFEPEFRRLFEDITDMYDDAAKLRRHARTSDELQKGLEVIFNHQRLGGLLSTAIEALFQSDSTAAGGAQPATQDAVP